MREKNRKPESEPIFGCPVCKSQKILQVITNCDLTFSQNKETGEWDNPQLMKMRQSKPQYVCEDCQASFENPEVVSVIKINNKNGF